MKDTLVKEGLDADRIVCSNGSDEMISLLCAAYVGPGDEVRVAIRGRQEPFRVVKPPFVDPSVRG